MDTLVWILMATSVIITLFIAISDNADIKIQLQNSQSNQRSLRLKRFWIWTSPVIAALLGFVSQISSCSQEAKIAKLEIQFVARNITETQKNIIRKSLKPSSQDKILVSWWPRKSEESANYANQIANVLIEAGFEKVECVERSVVFMDGEQGVQFAYASNPSTVENARRIRQAFDGVVDAVYEQAEAQVLSDGYSIEIYVIHRSLPTF